MIRKCVDCGRDFEITEGEIEFYNKKNMNLPKRCKECRDKKKNGGKPEQNTAKPAQNTAKPAQSSVPSGNGGKKPKKLGITAAGILAAIGILFGGNSVVQNLNQNPAPEESEIGYVTELEDQAVVEDLDNLEIDLGDVVAVVDETAVENETVSEVTETEGSSQTTEAEVKEEDKVEAVHYTFAKKQYLTEHFEKHGGEFDYANEEEYLEGANRVINDPNSLHKLEKEDGDDVYFLESTGEFVVVSKKGFIRTYFIPSAGIKYYNRQ